MKILIDQDVLGELDDDGTIVSADIWLKKLGALLAKSALPYLDLLPDGLGEYREVKKGEEGYYYAVVNALLDAGYDLE